MAQGGAAGYPDPEWADRSFAMRETEINDFWVLYGIAFDKALGSDPPYYDALAKKGMIDRLCGKYMMTDKGRSWFQEEMDRRGWTERSKT